jgi:hypothetical protein
LTSGRKTLAVVDELKLLLLGDGTGEGSSTVTENTEAFSFICGDDFSGTSGRRRQHKKRISFS